MTGADDPAHRRSGPAFDALVRAAGPLARRFVNLESPSLVVAAMKRSGASDLDVGPIAEPLEILSRSLDREANLHALGRRNARARLTALLASRGRLTELTARHPEILAESIDAPIVVAGLPGSGATYLQRLLALDPGLRPMPDGDAGATQADLASMDLEMRWHVPAYAEWYDGADLGDAYRSRRTLLRMQQWERPGGRWLLQSPQHLERLVELRDVFPDAVVVQIHRDPVAIVAATASAVASLRRASTFDAAPQQIGKYWAWRVERLLGRSIEQRAATGTPVVDVRFDDLRADPMAVVEDVYRAADRPLTDEARVAMEQHRHHDPAVRSEAPSPTPADFGLDADDLRRRFADYADRFDVRPET